MFLTESYNTVIAEAKMVFARRGKKVTRKFRCTVGKRKGKVVASPQQCTAPIDLKKRFILKKTKAMKGSLLIKRSNRTKRINPASRIVQNLNKRK